MTKQEQIQNLVMERKLIENEKRQLQRAVKDFFTEIVRMEKLIQARKATIQTYTDRMAQLNEDYYKKGNELEELTGCKRVETGY